MKIAKFFAALFALAGAVLMVGAVVLCLTSLDAPVQIREVPDAARACSETLMEAFAAGDYSAAESCLYGRPDLGVPSPPADPVTALVWEGFVGSISYEFRSGCYATDSGFARDLTVTTLDIPSVTDALNQRAQALLAQQVDSAAQPSDLYGENGQLREERISAILRQAAQEVLSDSPRTVSYETTLALVRRDGRWWAVPDQALLKAVSGGLA